MLFYKQILPTYNFTIRIVNFKYKSGHYIQNTLQIFIITTV